MRYLLHVNIVIENLKLFRTLILPLLIWTSFAVFFIKKQRIVSIGKDTNLYKLLSTHWYEMKKISQIKL